MEEKEVMTPKEFEEEMARLAMDLEKERIFEDGYVYRYTDKEDTHRAMDRVMCELLESLGYEKGVYIFKHTPKWYA